MLTDLKIQKAKPKNREYYIADSQGLYIRISPSGGKFWILRYSFLDKRKKYSLGPYPAVRLVEAREKKAEALRLIAKGIDPAEQAEAAKKRRKAEPTFRDLFNEYWSFELSKTPSAKERRRLIEKDVLEAWADKKLQTITRRDAVLLIRSVGERAPIVANRLQGVLVRAFNFACENGLLEVNPLLGLRRAEETPRSRVLTDKEILKLWNGLSLETKNIDMSYTMKLALKTILLTGQRPGEVIKMKWDQLKNGWWTIPADTTKTGKENKVPFFPMFEETIESARKYSVQSDFVFDSLKRPGEPIKTLSLSQAVRRHYRNMEIEDQFTPHDLRRTFRTRLAELGISDVVAEKCLGHSLGGILAVYNRHEYLDEKRAAYSSWERRLRQILGIEQPAAQIINFKAR